MISRDLTQLLNVADKEAQKRGDQFIASRAVPARAADDKGEPGSCCRTTGCRKGAREGDRGSARRRERATDKPTKAQREALKKYTLDLTERARRASSTR